MRIQHDENNKQHRAVTEGFTKSKIIGAVETYYMQDKTIIENLPIITVDVSAIILNLVVVPNEAPFEVTTQIWSFLPKDDRKGSLWLQQKVYETAGVKPRLDEEGYDIYNPSDLIGRFIYPLFYKNEKGFMDMHKVVARDSERDMEWVKDGFIKELGHSSSRITLHENSIFNSASSAAKEIDEKFTEIADKETKRIVEEPF